MKKNTDLMSIIENIALYYDYSGRQILNGDSWHFLLEWLIFFIYFFT